MRVGGWESCFDQRATDALVFALLFIDAHELQSKHFLIFNVLINMKNSTRCVLNHELLYMVAEG